MNNTDFRKSVQKNHHTNKQQLLQQVATKSLGKEGESDLQIYYIIIFRMSSFKQNITICTNKHESIAHKKEKKKLLETIPEEAQTPDLLNKDFKSSILNISKELKEATYRYLKQIIRNLSHQIKNINKEI